MRLSDPLRRGVAAFARSNRVPPPVRARHAEWSAIASLDDDPHGPGGRLVRTCLAAAEAALSVDLEEVAADLGEEDRRYLTTWPGEHYRLLAGFVASQGVERAVEIGTFRGVGARCLRSAGAQVTTFDVLAPGEIEGSLLSPPVDGIDARVGDLADPRVWAQHRGDIAKADLIFLDGPKDDVFEPRVLDHLVPLVRETGALLVVDDIRVVPMLQTWRDIPLPKLDLTSFGHWSGTGVAQVS